MKFLISDTFTDGLARLAAPDQKAAKTTAFDLQVNPAHPGLQFHKLDNSVDTEDVFSDLLEGGGLNEYQCAAPEATTLATLLSIG